MMRLRKILTSFFILVAAVLSFSIVSPVEEGANNLSLSDYTDRVLSLCSTYSVDLDDYRQTLDYSDVRKINNEYMISTSLLSSRLGIDIELDSDKLQGATIVKLSNSGRVSPEETVAYGNDIRLDGTDKLVSLDLCADSLGYEINYKQDSIDVIRPYLTKRLVVKTAADIDYMGAIDIVSGYENEMVLQYATEEDARAAHLAYKGNEAIEYVDIDFVVETMETANSQSSAGSTYSYRSWGANAMGVGTYTKNLIEDVGSVSGLDENIVAVIDTGIDTDHPWFTGRIVSGGKNYTEYEVKSNEIIISVSNNIEDDEGHGTHVSGIICDLTPSNVKILPMKVLDKEGKGLSVGITAAMREVLSLVRNGKKISAMNMSLGGAHSVGDEVWDGYNEVVVALKSYNVPTVVAAGNDSKSVVGYSPANVSQAITVASVSKDSSGKYYRSSFSNYGTYVDVAAPGGNILGACMGGGEVVLSGTSMAAPHVAAAVALLYSDPDTSYTSQEIESILKTNAIDLGNTGWDSYYGEGMVSLEYVNSKLLSSNVVFGRTTTECADPFKLSLSIAESGAVICYTIDGSVPTLSNGTRYTTPFDITTTTVVKAIAFILDSAGKVEKYSRVVSMTYTFGNQDTADSYVVDENGVLLKYNGIKKELTVPTIVNGVTVVAVGSNAFTHTTVERICLPATVTIIKENAFEACSTIVAVDAPGVVEIEKYAFFNCVKFDSLTVDYFPVLATIGDYAFVNCFKICNIDLPSVSSVGEYAFYMDSSYGTTCMQSAKLPNATYIGEYAFACCNILHIVELDKLEMVQYATFYDTDIETLSLGSAVRVASYAFYNNTILASVSMPRVEFIGFSAFGADAANANMLTRVELPELKYLAPQAFADSTKMTTFIAPNLQYVGRFGFGYCSKLNTVDLGQVAIVGEGAFYYCTALEEVDLPYVIEVRASAFAYAGLKRISLCVATEYIGIGALYVVEPHNLLVQIHKGNKASEDYVIDNHLEFAYVNEDYNYLVFQTINGETISITGVSSAVQMPDEVVVPEYLGANNLPVTTIAATAFRSCQSITKLISKTITRVEENAFYSCQNLTYVSLENVTYIGQMAFYRCEYLTHVDIPKVKTIALRGFYGCNRLESITLNSSVESLGQESLAYMSNGITNPDFTIYYNGSSVPSFIITYASSNGVNYKAVYKNIAIDNIEYTVWNNGENEEMEIVRVDNAVVGGVVIPETVDGKTVTSIGAKAFRDCEFITGVKLPSTIQYIGESAFEGCGSLEEINLDNVREISNSAFRVCFSLKVITLPEAVTISNYAFYACSDLEEVNIPKVSRIETNAFALCENLQVVNSPKLESLNSYAFSGATRLSKIDTFSLKYVGEVGTEKDIFKGCYYLKEIDLPNVISIVPTAFNSSAITKVCIGKNFMPYSSASGSMDTNIDIYGYAGSTAETFANANGNDFYPIDDIAFTKNLPDLIRCIEGSSVKLSVTAVGYGLSYNWYLTNSTGSRKELITGANTCETIVNTEGINTWYYYVEVTDWTGTIIRSRTCKVMSVERETNYTITPEIKGHYSCRLGFTTEMNSPLVVSSSATFSNGVPVEFFAETGYSIHTVYLVGDDGIVHTFPKMDNGHYCSATLFTILDAENRVTQNYIIYATTVPRADINYKVEHYKEVLEQTSASIEKNGLYFELVETEELQGVMEGRTNAQPNGYAGYSSMDYNQKEILANGKQVVQLFYTRNFYTVALDCGLGVASVSGGGRFKMGTTINISAIMSKGYNWSKWVSNNTDILEDIETQETSIVVPLGDIKLTAVGTVKYYKITVVKDDNCIVTPGMPVNEVPFNSTLTYTFKALDDYKISSVVINGVNYGAIVQRKLSSIDEDILIEVTTEKKKVAITIEANVAGINETISVDIGSPYSYTVPQKAGYEIYHVLVDGEEKEMVDGKVEIESLSENITIEVFYAEIRNPGSDNEDIITPPSDEKEPGVEGEESQQPTQPTKDDNYNFKPIIIAAIVIGLLFVITLVRTVKKTIERSNRL